MSYRARHTVIHAHGELRCSVPSSRAAGVFFPTPLAWMGRTKIGTPRDERASRCMSMARGKSSRKMRAAKRAVRGGGR